MAGNNLIKSIEDPKAAQELKVKKERGDVTRSLNSIEGTLKEVLDTELKLQDTKDKPKVKQYKKQIKNQNKHVTTLFETLKIEMKQAIAEERILYEMGPK